MLATMTMAPWTGFPVVASVTVPLTVPDVGGAAVMVMLWVVVAPADMLTVPEYLCLVTLLDGIR